MPWLKLSLEPDTEWNTLYLEDWEEAIRSFFARRGESFYPKRWEFPGYYIIEMGKNGEWGEITLSQAEKVVVLKNLRLGYEVEDDFAIFICKFARQMGAANLFIFTENDHTVWYNYGAIDQPDPEPLKEDIVPEKVGIEPLKNFALGITYGGYPVLCLEPIQCTARSSKLISLSQQRLEKMLGSGPIGFASRMAVQCPWFIEKKQWQDLLAWSRLRCFDRLYEAVKEAKGSCRKRRD